jgi:hypothetical protein
VLVLLGNAICALVVGNERPRNSEDRMISDDPQEEIEVLELTELFVEA